MSKKVSIAAFCVGLLCTVLCACAYDSQGPPAKAPDSGFWEMAGCGVMLMGLGVRGMLGNFDG
jgi:hypothetical protein